jgi:hypothetical protein
MMARLPKQFIIQFKVNGHGSVEDFDRLGEVECTLDGALRRNGQGHVDGHDIGSGEMLSWPETTETELSKSFGQRDLMENSN